MSDALPAAPAAPEATPAPVAPAPEATATPGGEAKPEGQQPPEKSFSQKELDEILEKRLAKERRKREELQRRLAVTEELALKGRAEPKQPAKPAEDGAPKREDFPDYESFIEAKAEWRADKKIEERFAKQREEESRNRTQVEQQKLEKEFRDHAAKVAKEVEDFEEVMESSEAPMTQAMADAMLSAGELGPKIAYHLAKNPEEAERIAALPAPRQAAEIGKLEIKLTSPEAQPKKPSKAPEPIAPVGGKAAKGDDEPDPSNTKAWIAWRERQIQKRRTGT